MNALPKSVRTSTGQTFHLTKEIGKGGEGAVYEAAEAGDLAFKLYWPDKAQIRREKLAAMASAAWYKTNPFVAFPIDILFSNGNFVGFVMRKVGGHKPVHLLFSPASRKLEFGRTNFRFLVRSAGNIARAVSSVHGTGCVIGDVNESGFLISDRATSVIIDSDSFQVASGQRQFLCQVGKREYTPPELQNSPLSQTVRTANHDNFGLAVLVFQLLFMGKHPFAGRYSGSEDMPIELAIAQYRFAYSAQSSTTKMKPPPGAPLLSDFPDIIGQAFERAFGRQGPTGRPSAAEWIHNLAQMEHELVQCSADNNHHHVRAKPCPWCRMEQNSPGFIAFGGGRQTVFVPTFVDAAQFHSILKAIGDLGAWPDFAAQLAVPGNLVAAPAATPLLERLKKRALTGLAASASGAILVCYGGEAIFPGICLLGIGLAANALPPKELVGLRQAQSQAEAAHRSVRDIWIKESADNTFSDTKRKITEKLAQLSGIPDEEKRAIADLEKRKKDLQLHRYLERFLIKSAKITKIGNGRKATLAAYNIETAADVEERKIQAIPGFGPGLISELVSWRRGLASRFVFNPNEPTNPSDLAALKSKLSAQKSSLEKLLRDSLNVLQQTVTQARNQQKKLTDAGNRTLAAVRQAELNVQAANGSLQKASKFISFCCAAIAAWGLLNSDGGKKTPPISDWKVQSSTPALPPNVAKPSFSPVAPQQDTKKPAFNSVAPQQDTKKPSFNPVAPQQDTNKQQAPGSVTPQLRPSPPSPIVTPATPTPPGWTSSTENPSVRGNPSPRIEAQTAPTLPAPQEIPSRPTSETTTVEATPLLDLHNSADATKVQQRLIVLGYMSGAADGKWGPKSKRALAEFKASKQLADEQTLDAITQQALFDTNQENQNFSNGVRPIDSMASALFGGWTDSQGNCGQPPEPPPMTIDSTGASTAGGFCEFSDIRQEANNVWRVSARCTVERNSWIANIRLALTSSSLRWTSERGEQIFFRCTNRVR